MKFTILDEFRPSRTGLVPFGKAQGKPKINAKYLCRETRTMAQSATLREQYWLLNLKSKI
ncbi:MULTISPECIES: hypothetical protein [Brasilonema]|uniref:hypothetical protein n=1 Tax=Brasilonema TaxID=383614 RepID=UPI00145D9022|nr:MULTISPECIES: hypothetical protein [Brasilonema]